MSLDEAPDLPRAFKSKGLGKPQIEKTRLVPESRGQVI